MQKKIGISIAAVAALMLTILAVNLAMGATSVANTLESATNALETVNEDDNIMCAPS